MVPIIYFLTNITNFARSKQVSVPPKAKPFRELRHFSLLTPKMGYVIKHRANIRGNLCWNNVWQAGTDGVVACPRTRRPLNAVLCVRRGHGRAGVFFETSGLYMQDGERTFPSPEGAEAETCFAGGECQREH